MNTIKKITVLSSLVLSTVAFSGDPIKDGNDAMERRHDAAQRGDAAGAMKAHNDGIKAAGRILDKANGGNKKSSDKKDKKDDN